MNIDRIMEFFYEKASRRIKIKVEESGLRHQDIYPNDYKQISWIINNNRTKNNRFLVSDAVVECYDDSESYGLLNKLDFNNTKKEIFWGTDEEINYYLFDLFELLWDSISDESSPYNIDKELYLCDYIPYAKYSTYWNILFSSENKYPAIAYGIYEDTVIENIDSARNNSLKFLYEKCQAEYISIFNEFANNTLSFHKIDKVFKESFIEKRFIIMLVKYKPDSSSLGLRVRDLIISDLSHCASIVFHENNDDILYRRSLINASSTYIIALEQIQARIFK